MYYKQPAYFFHILIIAFYSRTVKEFFRGFFNDQQAIETIVECLPLGLDVLVC